MSHDAGLNSDGKSNQKAYELLHSMKNTCQKRRPGVSNFALNIHLIFLTLQEITGLKQSISVSTIEHAKTFSHFCISLDVN